jgi:palmitoyltransferase
MAYLVLATFFFSALGYPQLFTAMGVNFQGEWPYHVPDIAYILAYILCVVLCFSVGVMLCFQLWTVSIGETAVEGQDHAFYRKTAKSRGDVFINSYDLGRRRNLQLFFNIGEDGYPWYTLVLPLRIAPYTDGRHWARREGFERHRGIRAGEELTDEEDED